MSQDSKCPTCGSHLRSTPDVDLEDVEFLLGTDSPEAIARRVGCADLKELTRALYRKSAFKLAGRLNA